ncbi:MAG TPA: T9SS type A sorting domain-containing protein [Luteibaculaceae bacterium]|nr:T9SS type A sorting domain-containing protein [Luteibaculaceae bacterium]
MKKTLLLLACALSVSAFSQTRYIDNLFQNVDVSTEIKYGTGRLESGTVVDLKFDIYQPQGDQATDRPLVIVAHGGSFIDAYGDKADAYCTDFAMGLAKKGYVVASINYREGWAFSPLNTQEQNARAVLPAVWRAIQDYKTAIRYFRNTIDQGNPYKIKSDLIIAGGFGAGGYLPTNAMMIDVPAEVVIPELQQKNAFGNPNGIPYIDTTRADLRGIFDVTGGSPNYSSRVDLVINISGAIPTVKVMDSGINPLMICLHSDQDEATPYKTDIVRAAGVFPVLEVSGSYVITNRLWDLNINTFWTNETRDGYPQVNIPDASGAKNMYQRGLYTFLGKPYMWSTTSDTYNATYETEYRTEMDTVVTFSAFRMEKWLREAKGVGIREITNKANEGIISIYPNPSTHQVTFKSSVAATALREVEIFDLQGKLIKAVLIIGGEGSIDVSSWPSGIYTVKMYTDNSILTDKLVVE